MVIGIDASRANKRQKTGVEWYSYHLIQELKKIIPDDITVRLYSRRALRDELAVLPRNWESCVLYWPPHYLWTVVRLSFEMWRRPPDLLFVPAHAIPPLLPKRVVTTVHDIGFERFPKLYRRRQRWYLHQTIRRALLRCDKVLTISAWTKSEIMDVYGARAEQLTVIPLAHDAVRFHADVNAEEQERARKRYGITPPYFLFFGRLERKKNIGNIVEAFCRFKETDTTGHTLVLVGRRGYGAEDLDAAIWRAGWASIRQLPWMPEEDRPGLLAGAQALVFPTRYEGFGMPILEAMAMGVPVITANFGATAEVAGDAALLVDPDDIQGLTKALTRMATDTAERAAWREAGLRRAAHFSWERTAAATWTELQNALPESRA